MNKEYGAEGLVLAGGKFHRRIIPERTIDVINSHQGLANMELTLVLNSGIAIPIEDILVPMACSEPSNN